MRLNAEQRRLVDDIVVRLMSTMGELDSLPVGRDVGNLKEAAARALAWAEAVKKRSETHSG